MAFDFRCLTALPVYNEVSHLMGVLHRVTRYADDVLVVDDGSTDGSSDLLRLRRDLRVIRHPRNLGYGAALATAFDYATRRGYNALVTIDCDGQHEPQLISALAEKLSPPAGSGQEPCDIVSGSRYLQPDRGPAEAAPADRRRINRTITRELNAQLGLRLTDAFCGFKAYRVDALSVLRPTEPGYAMPLELWVQAACHGLRIRESPVPLIYLDEKRSFGGALDEADQRLAYYRRVIARALAATRRSAQDSRAAYAAAADTA